MTNTNLSKPEVSEKFIEYLTEAYEQLVEKQELIKVEYGFGSHERWFYDQETGLIEFFDGDTLKLRIIYQEVGSISNTSGTWLWSWANPHILDKAKSEMEFVKEFGEEVGFERLTKSKWEADETDGWEMTSVAARVLQAKGAYRMPLDNLFSFVLFMSIKRMD